MNTIFQFQVDYLSDIENDCIIDYNLYINKLKQNRNVYIDELSRDFLSGKNSTFISIVYLDFVNIYNTYYVNELIKKWINQFDIENIYKAENVNEYHIELLEKSREFIQTYFLNDDEKKNLNNEIQNIFFKENNLEKICAYAFKNSKQGLICQLINLCNQKNLVENIAIKILISDISIIDQSLVNKLNGLFEIGNIESKNLSKLINKKQNQDIIINETIYEKNKTYWGLLKYLYNNDEYVISLKRFVCKKIFADDFDRFYYSELAYICNTYNFIDINHVQKMIYESQEKLYYNIIDHIEITLGTNGLWPIKVKDEYNCEAFKTQREIIEEEFKEQKKKLIWIDDLTTAEISFNGYTLIVPLKMVDLILKFNDKDEIEYNSSIYVKFLLKINFIKLNGDKIVLNYNFKPKDKVYDMKKKLDVMIKKYKQKKVKPKKSSDSSLESIYICECAVIKIMKKHRELELTSIYEKLEEQKHRFKLTNKLLDKTLNSLIKKEFVSYESNKYSYIP